MVHGTVNRQEHSERLPRTVPTAPLLLSHRWRTMLSIRQLVLFLAWLLPVTCLVKSQIARPSPTRFSADVSWRNGKIVRHSSSNIEQVASNGREPATKAPYPEAEALVSGLLQCFQGEFDNYDQVVKDRAAGMTAGPGGGHEHIHCSLTLLDERLLPQQILRQHSVERRASTVAVKERGEGEEISNNLEAQTGEDEREERPLAVVAAKYYFNGDASIVFRYRLYSFHRCPQRQGASRGDAMMRLWRLIPSVEKRLRATGYDLTSFQWQEERKTSEGDEHAGDNADSAKRRHLDDSNEVAECMHGCEIYWSRGGQQPSVESPSQVGQQQQEEEERLFVGLMGEDDDGTWVASQNMQGLEILIKDDLKVWPDRLWVNDRGFDREGKFVYGNQRGVPYMLKRVSPGDGDNTLQWTLGEQHRMPGLYADKMSAIGVVPGQRFGPPPPATTAIFAAGEGE